METAADTLLYIKQITNNNLLYSTGNSSQYSVMTYIGEESKKEWIYEYVMCIIPIILKYSRILPHCHIQHHTDSEALQAESCLSGLTTDLKISAELAHLL